MGFTLHRLLQRATRQPLTGWSVQSRKKAFNAINFARVDGYLFPHAHTKEAHDKLLKVNTFTALIGGKSLPFFFQMPCKEHEV